MPDKGKRPARKRRSDELRECDYVHDGRRQRRPRVDFGSRRCRLCQDSKSATEEKCNKCYVSRNSMTKHTVLDHKCWYK